MMALRRRIFSRRALFGILGTAGKDAWPALGACMSDPDAEVRNSSAAALQRLDPEKYRHLKATIK